MSTWIKEVHRKFIENIGLTLNPLILKKMCEDWFLKLGGLFLFHIFLLSNTFAAEISLNQTGIEHDKNARKITLRDPKNLLSIEIDYAKGCRISRMQIHGKDVLSIRGIYTGLRTKEDLTAGNTDLIQVKQNESSITLSNIRFSSARLAGVERLKSSLAAVESWKFSLVEDKIVWEINREYPDTATLEETYFPQWNFKNMDTWKGGIIDNGGMVWCKYLSRVNDTYGVHTGGVTFWEPVSGDALQIDAKAAKGTQIGAKFSHSDSGEFTFTQMVSDNELGQRYGLSRFVSGKADVFAPHQVKKGNIKLSLTLAYMDYNKVYSRGTLSGIDEGSVRELMNTTGRYGVVDNNIIGANGWVTNWKCLHEPFFAQIGMALNDPKYTANFSSTLDQERDLAMLADGRVLSRWHNAAGDEIPGTYNAKTGYYEAMWGYTIDSQTGYVINASEQFNLNGDLKWLRGHKESAEKALDWLIRRDEDGNDIFEMKNTGVLEEKASDWLDIVWASYENAFVNAQMYEALHLWADCEEVLGDTQKGKYYREVAQRLKIAFNKPIEAGGFWSEAKKQYVYWRDKDGSIHGDNLVTPVNFAAIAFGLCDDTIRIAQVLDQIEKRNVQENLFHWPLCYDSFKNEEVQYGNWPFPKYENGDIFPTWGYLGIRAYVKHDKGIALKYVKNILEQYRKDGLSSQRYSRTTQKGLGEDILAGISTTITGLYRDIYGIRPKWNRMGLEPNMVDEANGTKFKYNLRDTIYNLELSKGQYIISTNDFLVRSNSSIGVSKKGEELVIYRDNHDEQVLRISSRSGQAIKVYLKNWLNDSVGELKLTGKGQFKVVIVGLKAGSYEVYNDQAKQIVKTNRHFELVLKGIKADQLLRVKLLDTQ